MNDFETEKTDGEPKSAAQSPVTDQKRKELDNVALSSLTLLANTRKLYQMRYVDLPQSYYTSYAAALANAMYYQSTQARLAPATRQALDQAQSPQEWNLLLLSSPEFMMR